MSRVFVVDDHPIVRQGIRDLLANAPDLEVGGEASNSRDALRGMVAMDPDLVLVDVSLGGSSGIDLIHDLRAQELRARVLVLSMHEDWIYAERCLRAGASGYVSKGEGSERLLEAIRRVAGGGFYLSDEMQARGLQRVVRSASQASDPVERLSEREFEVFQKIGAGRATREIAHELGVSVKTVETHRARIKEKLGLESGVELQTYLLEEELPARGQVDDVEIVLDLPGRGSRTVRLNGCALDGAAEDRRLLLALEDVTDRRRREQGLRDELQTRADLVNLAQEVAAIVDSRIPLHRAVRSALEAIARTNGWDVAHLYLVTERPEGKMLVEAGLSFAEDPERFAPFLAATAGRSFRLGEWVIGLVGETGESRAIPDLWADADYSRRDAARAAGLRTAYVFPIRSGVTVWGVMEFVSSRQAELEAPLLVTMRQAGEQLGRLLERRQLEQQVVEVNDRAQQRFARDLHDSIGQQVAGIGMMGRRLGQELERANPEVTELISRLNTAIDETMRQLRLLARGLMPLDLEDGDLSQALDSLARRVSEGTALDCRFETREAQSPEDPAVATHLFRIAHEAIRNAVEHARARNLVVTVAREDDGDLVLEIRDDGEGAEPVRQADGLGIQIMRHRANLVGAELTFETSPDGGTAVRCVLESV